MVGQRVISVGLRDWSFEAPVKLRFGAGSRSALAPLLGGKRVLVVTTVRGRQAIETDPVFGAAFQEADVEFATDIRPNPGIHDLQAQVDSWAGRGLDLVVAIGGGSVLDAAKVFAASLGGDGRSIADLLSNSNSIGSDNVIPLVALPTTAGTGSEMTPFATVWDHEQRRKLSLSSPHIRPWVAIVDPELTLGLPDAVTISTALDALNQAFESVWNRNANPVTLGVAVQAIRFSFEGLEAFAAGNTDLEVRSRLAEASVLAGLCISQTRTAICHAISYPLTAHFGVPHGLACAFTMVAVARLYSSSVPGGLDLVARVVGEPDGAALLARLDAVMEKLAVRERVSGTIGTFEDLLALRAEMYAPGRADNFPVGIDDEALSHILAESYSREATSN